MVDESHRMSRLVESLLDMTRLESGAVELNRQWHVLEELVVSALGRLRRQLAAHCVRVDIPPDPSSRLFSPIWVIRPREDLLHFFGTAGSIL